jgi:hypothetical protein
MYCRRLERFLSFFLTLVVSACAGDLNLPNDVSPARLVVVSGDDQEATVGTELPAPLVVQVIDAAENPLANVPLIFLFQEDVPDGRIDPPAVETDSGGRASVRVQLGTVTGAQPVVARVDAEAASGVMATFDLTALRERGGGGHGEDDDKEKDKNKGKGSED